MGGRIATTLSEPGRLWTPNPPADEAAIARLCASAPFEFPAEYLELLRFCNDGVQSSLGVAAADDPGTGPSARCISFD